MFDKIFNRKVIASERRNNKDGIPQALYDEAIKMLQEAKKDGKQQFVLAIAITKEDGAPDAFKTTKVMSDGVFSHTILGLMNEYLKRNDSPALRLTLQALHAMFHGAPVQMEVADEEVEEETRH